VRRQQGNRPSPPPTRPGSGRGGRASRYFRGPVSDYGNVPWRNVAPYSPRLAGAPAAAFPLLLASVAGLAGATGLRAQDAPAPSGGVIDTVVVTTENVFSAEETAGNFFFRLLNDIRFTTRPRVIRKEILFEAGEVADSARLAETERNLRALGLFRSVSVDTTRVEGRLRAEVRTKDSWSTQPILRFSASKGTWTGKIGIVEKNLFGTGNRLRLAWRKDVDRNAFELDGQFRRILDTEIDVAGVYNGLSDGNLGAWWIGDPWRSSEDGRAVAYFGDAADRRIIQYRIPATAVRDTTLWQVRSYGMGVTGAVAPLASPGRYLRTGIQAEVRNDRYFAFDDSASLASPPDSFKAWVGGFAELRRNSFQVRRYVNGFSPEDVDLSPYAFASVRIAPEAFGYERTGLGLAGGGGVAGAIPSGDLFYRLSVAANGLFSGGGIDSARVVVTGEGAAKPAERHVALVLFRAGAMDDPTPGTEFDLGFDAGPRLWEPHSFVGTRAVWGTFEYRWYIWDELLNLLGLGVATFLDYGGAWYPDQDPRWGGNAGVGLRLGSTRSSVGRTIRVDLGYRFGEGTSGDRWALGVSSGFRLF
jgi:hypothetical protein